VTAAAPVTDPGTEPETPGDFTVVTDSAYTLAINDPFAADADGNAVRLVRVGETNLGDLIADAYRVQGHADIGLVDGGSICGEIPAGEITEEDIERILPYGDELCVVAASGQQILDALEWASRAVPNEFGGFLQVSGLSYEIHSYVDNGCVTDENACFAGVDGERRVKNVVVNGEALEPEKIYTVAGPSFILLENGGGNTGFAGAAVIAEHIKPDTQVLIDTIIDELHGVIGEDYADPYGQGRIVIFEVAPAKNAPAETPPAEEAPAAAEEKPSGEEAPADTEETPAQEEAKKESDERKLSSKERKTAAEKIRKKAA